MGGNLQGLLSSDFLPQGRRGMMSTGACADKVHMHDCPDGRLGSTLRGPHVPIFRSLLLFQFLGPGLTQARTRFVQHTVPEKCTAVMCCGSDIFPSTPRTEGPTAELGSIQNSEAIDPWKKNTSRPHDCPLLSGAMHHF